MGKLEGEDEGRFDADMDGKLLDWSVEIEVGGELGLVDGGSLCENVGEVVSVASEVGNIEGSEVGA